MSAGPMRRRTVAVVAVGALLLAGCTQSSSSVDLPSAADYETELLGAVNALRVEEGVAVLQTSECLSGHARDRAAQLPGAVEVPREDLPADCGDYDYAGENVSRSDQIPVDVVDQWASNSTQYPNLVDPAFEIAGVGCVPVSAADNSEVATGDDSVGGMACSMIFQGYAP